MINVHHHATKPLPKLILVNTDKEVATYTDVHHMIFSYEYITNDQQGWPIDGDVGDYICSYDDFQRLYPEYFI